MSLKNCLSIRAKVLTLSVVFSIGFIVLGAIALSTVHTTKVGGHYYNGIICGKDLIADVLPPPGYIVEAYLTVELMSDAHRLDGNQLNELIAHFSVLKQDHQNCMRRWKTMLPEGELKRSLLLDANRPAQQFFDIVERDLIPALKTRNITLAENLADESLGQLFAEHKSAMDKVVQLANQYAAEKQQLATSSVVNGLRWLVAAALFIAIAVASISLGLYRNVGKQECANLDYEGQIQAIRNSQAVLEFDVEGRILFCNENISKVLGMESSELIGVHHSAIMSRNAQSTLQLEELWGFLQSGQAKVGEFAHSGRYGNVYGCKRHSTLFLIPIIELRRL